MKQTWMQRLVQADIVRRVAAHAPKSRFSLKWRMIQMLIVCWVLPVMVVIGISGAQLVEEMTVQSKARLQAQIDSAMQLTALRMDSAIQESRAISYVGTIRDAWMTYQADSDRVKLYEMSRRSLEQQYQFDEKFSSTILLFLSFENEPIYAINSSAGGTERVRTEIDEITTHATQLSAEIGTGMAFFSVGDRIFMMRNLVDAKYQPIAVLMMELNQTLFFSEFAQFANMEFSTVQINDVAVDVSLEEPHISQMPLEPHASLVQSKTEGIQITFEDDVMYAQAWSPSYDYALTYATVYHPMILQEQRRVTMFSLGGVFLFMLPLGALILAFFVLHVTKPLHEIIRSTNEIRNKHYGVQVPEHALQSEEIGLLGDNFNSMSMTLQEQFEHIYKEELALRDARIMALQSQINPHFLNNTLEIINWEARMEGDLKVCSMLESLSTMLRAAMDRRNRPMVSLSEELMYVDAYLYIINERLGKRLVVEKEIPEAFLDCRVPRLILQPILENAVNHGITPVQQGRIVLRAEQEGEWLVFSVANNGNLSQEDQARIQMVLQENYEPENGERASLGLRNVHQRLRIIYGEEGGVLVDLTKKDMVVVKLRVKIS